MDAISDSPRPAGRTPGGIAVTVRVTPTAPAGPGVGAADIAGLWLRVEHARLRLLRGFEELLCLEGLHGVEQLPHQIETVRRVLRHFRGGVLLADEVGLGKTIEAGLLLREYLLRGMVKRVLILVPPALVSQWSEELSTKFGLDFTTAESGRSIKDDFWRETDRVLASLSLAKSARHFEAVSACSWDLIIVDEAHHCRNRSTRNWQLVNALKRRRMFLLTATPVQNDLLELYNLLTLLEPGHLKTETDFKKNYVRRGNPRDPRNRERLRELLGEVMIRNTRSLVTMNLPPRYAQTFVVHPDENEAKLYQLLDTYLRWRSRHHRSPGGAQPGAVEPHLDAAPGDEHAEPDLFSNLPKEAAGRAVPINPIAGSASPADEQGPSDEPRAERASAGRAELSRMRITSLLLAAGSHPAALVAPLADLAEQDSRVGPIVELARKAAQAGLSSKEAKLVELLAANRQGKALVFANFTATLDRLADVLTGAGIRFCVFTGRQTAAEKAKAVESLRDHVPVMLCSEIGGEGHNLQFANTLINFDLPWNPMRIEQRVGRIHRIGQTCQVFIFNLCTAGSLEERILRLLHEKIRMFELVVGEVGSILGNLEGGEEFESLVLNLWLQSRGPEDLDQAFEQLGDSLLAAQEEYLETKRFDEALFGDEYE
jgi:SNF2 family DNA or RNA helicase